MTTLDNYLGIVKQEIDSGNVKVRRDAHIDYRALEQAMTDASIVVGADKFEDRIINPLMQLSLYVKSQFSTAVSIMKYFPFMDAQRKASFASMVGKILKEKHALADHNRIYDPDYTLSTASLKSDLFYAYLEVRQEYKKPNRKEIKELKKFFKGEK
jgi:hypothetical protein